jgi:cell division protein FtsQ
MTTTVVGSARIAQRRRSVRREERKRRRRIACAAVVIAVAIYGGFALSRSSVFRLSSIQVVGAHGVTAQEVIDASGLHAGQRALSLDLSAAAARVRAMLPTVRDVTIQRTGALGVRIVIAERTPALQVQAADGRFVLDQDGVEMQGVAATRGLPLVTLPPGDAVASGAQPLSSDAVRATLSFWHRAPSWLRRSIVSFAPTADGQIVFDMDRTVVVFGYLEQMRTKILALQMVIARVHRTRHRLLEINLRAPDRPTARIA